MDIELNAHDLILAAHYAGLIEGVKSVLLQQGSIKNNKISGQTDFGIHYAGMLGEVAVGKTTGIPLHTDITFGGDGNVDMIIADGTNLYLTLQTNYGVGTVASVNYAYKIYKNNTGL